MGLNHDFKIISKQQVKENDNLEYDKLYPYIKISDNIFILLFEQFKSATTYWHTLDIKNKGFAYHGITLIPPKSLPDLKVAVSNCYKINSVYNNNSELLKLKNLIDAALIRDDYIIHYGI